MAEPHQNGSPKPRTGGTVQRQPRIDKRLKADRVHEWTQTTHPVEPEKARFRGQIERVARRRGGRSSPRNDERPEGANAERFSPDEPGRDSTPTLVGSAVGLALADRVDPSRRVGRRARR